MALLIHISFRFRHCVSGDISHNPDCHHTIGQEDQDIHTDHQGGSKVSRHRNCVYCTTVY